MAPAGKQRKRVTFERRPTTRDDYGAQSNDWSALFTMWGGLRETSGRERVRAGALQAPMSGVLTVRSMSDTRGITEADRVKIDGVVWNIRGIRDPDQRRRDIEMDIERNVAT